MRIEWKVKIPVYIVPLPRGSGTIKMKQAKEVDKQSDSVSPRDRYPDAVGTLTKWTIFMTGHPEMTVNAETSYRAFVEAMKLAGLIEATSLFPKPTDMIFEQDRAHLLFKMASTTWSVNAHRHVREGDFLGCDELGEDFKWVCCAGCRRVLESAYTVFAFVDLSTNDEITLCGNCKSYYEYDMG